MPIQDVKNFIYADISPITSYIEPKKQAAKRHYGSHQYFTKRAWNVVQAYIDKFTLPGDVVCDPFAGSGVTAIEALILQREAVYMDISPWATFLAEQVALAPVNLGQLEQAYVTVEKACAKKINSYWHLSNSEVEEISINRWYPKAYPLPKNADVAYVEDLYTHRQLLALSELWYHIGQIKDEVNRNLLRYAFSATLYMCNKTFLSAKGRKASRGGSSIFSIYRYKVAAQPVELNVWDVFEKRFGGLLTCKKETNQEIGSHKGGSSKCLFLTGKAQNLTEYVKAESVDYIFTDPPYGGNIAYLDLTRMWDAWFGFEISDTDRAAEAIEGGDIGHSSDDYKAIIANCMQEMFKVLKYDRWMSLVFAHREPALWDGIVKSAEGAGFEYVNTVCQPLSVVWSMHKKKNPLTVLSGELVLNFRKVKNPKTVAIISVGSPVVSLIKEIAELTIVERGGATTEEIYSDLIPKLLEHGLLGTVTSQIGDITPLLAEEFVYDQDSKVWYPKPNKKLGCHIPLEQRIRFYVVDFLTRCDRLGKKATIDDIVFTVLPKLKNGQQPTKQHIIAEIRKVAVPYKGKFWVLARDDQYSFDFTKETTPAGRNLTKLIQTPNAKLEHNDIIYALAQMGKTAGFGVHIGKKEQSIEYQGEDLRELSVPKLDFLRGQEVFTKKNIQQIDVLWLDGKFPAMAFEVEHSTPFTTAIERFIELLKLRPKLSGHLVIVAPRKRQRKLNEVLSKSHFIGAPMYFERKVRYLWYDQLKETIKRFTHEQSTKSSLLESIMERSRQPELSC